jgi:hypothetical protein
MRRGTAEHSASKIAALTARLVSFEHTEETITEAMVRLNAPTQRELATAGPLSIMLEKEGPSTSHQLPEIDLNTVHGMLTKNAKMLELKTTLREQRALKVAESETKERDYLLLKKKFFKCKESSTCTCGNERCVQLIYLYCRTCDIGKKDKCIQKSLCGKQACKAARMQLQSPPLPPPNAPTPSPSLATTVPTSASQLQPPTTLRPIALPQHSTLAPTQPPTQQPRIAPSQPSTSSLPQPTTSLPARLALPDPNCITCWGKDWGEGVFNPQDKLMVKEEVEGKSLWRLGYVLVVHPNAVKLEYHEVGGRTPKEVVRKSYLTRERYGPQRWWVFLERAIVDHSQKRRKIQKNIQEA